MIKGRGFTIVELVITITIMGILLTLAVVSLSSSEANGRDSERKADVESLSFNLENFYANQDAGVVGSGGRYPGTTNMNSETKIRAQLPDVDPKNLRAPDVSESGPISVVMATNTSTSVSGITPRPTINNDVYVYQPLTTSGTLCTDSTTTECRRFNVYYLNERDGTVEKVTSKHQ